MRPIFPQATLETSTWLPYVIGSSKRVKSLAYDASRGGHLAVGVAGMAAVFRRRGEYSYPGACIVLIVSLPKELGGSW